MQRWATVIAVIEDGYRHSNRDIAQQTKFGKIPVGAVPGHGRLCEDQRLFGVEQLTEEILFCHRLQIRVSEAISKVGTCLSPTSSQRLQVVGGADQGILGNDDRVAGRGSGG